MLNQNKRYMKDTTKPESRIESWKKILLVLTQHEVLSSAPENTACKKYIINSFQYFVSREQGKMQ